ncbi:ABC transporter substrate-binding protein [Actinomadura sp. 6N118]|uniref:ABC transporter substrate-binding protein n=1 Tax=Actinomadura sp. 6N118 TaxID=3375151 RepID=UPI0037A29ACB
MLAWFGNLPLTAKVVLVTASLAGLTAGGWGVLDWNGDRDDCGDARGGVKRHDGECVGVTDGSAKPFHPALKNIQEKIHAENKRVDSQPDMAKVSIVYLAPMSVTAKDPTTLAGARHQLEGAYLAQVLLNERSGNTPGVRAQPQIKLLLANAGAQSGQWEHAVKQIQGRTGTSDKVVGVAGLGPSTETTRAAMSRLAEHRIPMVGSIFSAPEIRGGDGRRLDARDGLFRVSPTNTDEVDALLKAVPPKGRIFLVQDNDRNDIYAQDMAQRFLAARVPGTQTEAYVTDENGRPAGGNAFLWIRSQLCGDGDVWIFFAGRGKQLQAMLETFADNPCVGQKMTIVSGDDALNIDWSAPKVKRALSKDITLKYAGLAHPEQWTNQPGFGAAFTTFASAHSQHGFKQADLIDGTSMMAYDSVLTLATAIRNGAGNTSTEGVQGMLLQLHHKNHVQGASGRIDLDNATGKAVNKAVPILQLTPQGVRAATVAWPSGKPS